MPFYEYLCDEGHEFEVEQRITEDALIVCEHNCTDEGHVKWCGETEVCGAPCHRLLSKSSFVLKGGGWSGDGYAKSGKGET